MKKAKVPNLPIAVVGMGCRFPRAKDTNAFWNLIENGQVAFSQVPKERWDHETFYSQSQRDVDKAWVSSGSFIAEFQDFAAMHYGIAPRRLDVMDPQQRLLIEATRWAIQDAGYERRGFDRRQTGVFFGVSVAEFKNIAQSRIHAMQLAGGDFGFPAGNQALRDALMQMSSRVAPMRAFHLSGSLTALAAATVSQTFDLGGPAYVIDSACASASVAVSDAVLHLRSGMLDFAVAGGAYINLSPDNLVAFTKIGAISPSGVCRPFDHRSDGFVQSDGVGVLMLRRLEDAVRDGDRIHAVILGSGTNNDGRGEGPMTPRFEGQLEVLKAAYRDADISPTTVDFFEAHGTATSIGDPVEVKALGTLLNEAGKSDKALLGSVKGNIGHAMSAAGIAGLIKAIKLLENGIAPPQPDFERSHPKLELEKYPLEISQTKREIGSGGVLRAAVSSFGFGGTNSHLVLERYEHPKRQQEVSRPIEIQLRETAKPEVLVVSGASSSLLADYLDELDAFLMDGPGQSYSLADVAFTLNARRTKERFVAVIGARSIRELSLNLSATKAAILGDPKYPLAVSPHASVFERDPAEPAPKLAFLFPGQGAQQLGVMRDVLHRFPQLKGHFDELAQSVGSLLERPLSEYLYPEHISPEAEAALTTTAVCQPSLAALSAALGIYLEDIGVKPSFVLGHSLGEFVALAQAGIIDRRAIVPLVTQRGLAMEALNLSDQGKMAAVMADEAAVRQKIQGIEGVQVANINHPRQVSISGTSDGVEQASAKLKADGFDVRPLEVSHAFHSPLLNGLKPAMEKILDSLSLSGPSEDLVAASCIADRPYTLDTKRTKQVLTLHTTSPVRFTDGLSQCEDADIFVQVGAGKALASFARATFKRTKPAVSLASVHDDGGYEFLLGLAGLYARGVEVNFESVYQGEQRRVVSLPETPVEREKYWVVKDTEQPVAELHHPLPEQGKKTVVLEGKEQTANTEGEHADLVSLFHKQADILRAHAEILAEQTRALSGVVPSDFRGKVPPAQPQSLTPVKPSPSSAPSKPEPEPSPSEAPKSSEPAANADSDSVKSQVMAIVSKISAFPEKNLRLEQRLVDELGFDSLMVADLGGAIESAFPGAGSLPPTLFSLETTVGDIADHIASSLSRKPENSEKVAPQAIRRYRVNAARRALVKGPLHSVSEQAWLVTEDGSLLSESLSSELAARGARVLRIQFTKNAAAPSQLSFGAVNLWPEAYVEGLEKALSDQNIELDGFLHAAGSGGESILRLLHPLASRLSASRLAVLTSMGGRLGLDKSAGRLSQAAALGYMKALGRERTSDLVRVFDVDPQQEPKKNAAWVIDELLGSSRSPEVGFDGTHRWVAELTEIEDGNAHRRISSEDVVFISGGTGDLGRSIARWVAEQKPKGLILGGRRPFDSNIEAMVRSLSEYTQVLYVAADITQSSDLAGQTRLFTDQVGPVTVAVHAAGFAQDAPASKKVVESMERVVAVKSEGTQAIQSAFPELQDLLLFGSWAGRFGNPHQTDYAAANDRMSRFAFTSTPARVVHIDWPPWKGSKMVDTIPASIQAMMTAQGVTFLSEREGVETFADIFAKSEGGIELVGRAVPSGWLKARSTQTFSEDRHIYLRDHRLNGQAIVPLASVVDWIAASLEPTPEEAIVLEGLQLVRGLRGGETAELVVEGERAEGKTKGEAEIKVEGQKVAYRAKVRTEAVQLNPLSLDGAPKAQIDLDAFYQHHTFHGPTLRGIKEVKESTESGIRGVIFRSEPSKWVQGRVQPWTLDPLVLDGAFQLAGLWLHTEHGKAGFPTGFDRLTLLGPLTGTIEATVVLKEITDATFSGDLALWSDGKLAARLDNMQGRFADLAASGEAMAESPKANGTPVRAVSAPEETWKVEQFPEVEALQQRFEMAKLMNLENPFFAVHDGTAKDTSVIGGKEMIHFSGYNYLGFSGRKEVVEAAQEAAAKFGTSVSASRIASGERPLHQAFERGIAEHLGVEDAILYVGGHATNVTTVGHILGKEDLVVHDALIHDSIFQGIKLSGAARRPYPHEDMDALEKILSQVRGEFRRVLICAEGIYSMDGDICNLPHLIELKKRYACLLLIDEAHSIGVLGPQGRGVGHHFDGVNPRDVDMWMGTLSKSFASVGGYIAGSKALVQYLKYTAPGFVYSVGLAPPNTAAALASLKLMQDEPQVPEKLRKNSQYFLRLCKDRHLDTGPAVGAAVVPVIVGDSIRCMKLAEALKEDGINVQPIVYPAVENEAARLRFFISALHTQEQLEFTAHRVAERLKSLDSEAPQLSL